MPKTQQEIVRQGYQSLVKTLGIVDAIKFIQYFSPGRGNYTQERHSWLQQTTPSDIFEDMRQCRDSDNQKYDELIE